MCRLAAAAVAAAAVHNQPLDSAVVTVTKKEEEKDIPPIFQIVYLPELDKSLCLIVDTASPHLHLSI